MQCPEYLLERINYETALEFDLHICERENSIYNERIIFPLYSKNNMGFIARDYTEIKPQKYLFPKNMPKQEFLFGKINSEQVIVVEGVFDVMKLWENGYKNCICPSGVVFSQEQAILLKSQRSRFSSDLRNRPCSYLASSCKITGSSDCQSPCL